MRDITIVMAYYENPNMLARQLDHLNKMNADILEHLEYVVVDDGSSQDPAVIPTPPLLYKYQLHRMNVDVRWNQDACRNLGVKNARHPWVFMTDMDHLIPNNTMQAIMFAKHLSEQAAYRFTRVDDETFIPYKFHPNSWLMTRELFWKIGGYDERFAGYYGTDWDFRDRALLKSEYIKQLPYPIIRVGREHTPDASCPKEFGRKTVDDSTAIKNIRIRRKDNPPVHDRFPNHMVFKWP